MFKRLKSLMQRLSRYALEAILTSIPVGVLVIEKENGKITYVNNRAIELFGVDPRNVENIKSLTKQLALCGEIYPQENFPAWRAILTGQETKEDLLIERPDGSKIVVSASATPITDENSNVIGAVTVFQNVTEHRRAEEIFKNSKRQYDLLFNSVTEGFAHYKAVYDENDAICDLLVLDINPAGAALSGVRREDQIGRTCRQALPDVPESLFDIYRQVDNSDQFCSFEHFNPTTKRWHIIHVDRIAKGDFVATFFDINDQKKTREKLIQAQNRLLVATKAAKLGIHDYNIFANTVQWDKRIREIWGIEPDEPITYETFIDNVHPDDRAAVQAEMNKALDPEKGEFYAEYRVINRKDKTVRWVYATGKTFFDDNHNAVRLIGTAEDITERKKAEEALRQQAQLLHLSYDAIIVWRKDGSIEHWNRGAEQLYGYTESEALGRVTHELLKTIHPVPWPEIEAAMRKHGQWEGELRHHAKDGHEVTISTRHQLVLETDGIERILETNRDITERKKAEEVLLKQAALIDLSPDGVVVKNFDDTVTFWSEGAEKLYGWTKEEAVGRKIIDLLTPAYPHDSSVEDVLKKLEMDGKWTGQLVHHAKDGHEIVVMSSWLAMVKNSGGMEILESNTDITEQVRLQTKLEEKAAEVEEYAVSMEQLAQNRLLQLRDAERLAAIGQTAGMVGHDIRNPLQSILGELYLAKT
jgi:PAS domain S-box-containing protein